MKCMIPSVRAASWLVLLIVDWFLRRQRGLSQRCIAFGFVSRSWVVLSFIGSGRIVDYTQFGHGLCGTRGQVRQQISTRAGVSYGPATELRWKYNRQSRMQVSVSSMR